jgi:hypothetical protein
MLIISRLNLFSIFIFLYGFIISFFFIPLHFGGDSIFYTKAYNAVASESNFFQAHSVYISSIYSHEIGQFLIYFIYSSSGLNKVLLDSFSNGFLYLLAFRLACNYGISFLLAFLLLSTNYYIFTLMFTLEKLKFSIIFLFLGILAARNKGNKAGLLFLLISAATHLQTIIYYLSYFSKIVLNKNIYNNKGSFLLFVLFSFIFYLFFKDYIFLKLSWYVNLASFSILYNFSKIFVFGILVFVLSGLKKEVALFYLILSLVAVIIGSDRIMMFAYFYFIPVAFNAGRYGRLALYASIAYMTYKSCKYIIMVLQTGG